MPKARVSSVLKGILGFSSYLELRAKDDCSRRAMYRVLGGCRERLELWLVVQLHSELMSSDAVRRGEFQPRTEALLLVKSAERVSNRRSGDSAPVSRRSWTTSLNAESLAHVALLQMFPSHGWAHATSSLNSFQLHERYTDPITS
jgi:hypothetical protein